MPIQTELRNALKAFYQAKYPLKGIYLPYMSIFDAMTYDELVIVANEAF